MDETARVCRSIGLRVFELREERRLTQDDLAGRMEIDPRDVRRIEAGDNVTIHMPVRLSKVLDVQIPSLFEPATSRHRRKPGRPRKRK